MYSSLAIIKRNSAELFDELLMLIQKAPFLGKLTLIEIPMVCFLAIAILTLILLSFGKRPGWRAVGVFFVSWVVGLIGCEGLAIYLVT